VAFYKNGVLMTTMTGVPATYCLVAVLSPWTAIATTSSANSIRMNFKGPFSYPVAGFSPYQWW
jgi:hypothetical protein